MPKKRRPGRPPHDDVLTPTEWRTVHAVQHGLTNREIAERRGISIDAVKYHVANALGKLGLKNRRALRQWFKAPKHGALAHQENLVSAELELGRIGQISRTVKDIREAEAWYRVDDIEAAHVEFVKRGVEFTSAPHKIYTHPDGTEEWMGFFKDPEGRPLAVMSQVKAR